MMRRGTRLSSAEFGVGAATGAGSVVTKDVEAGELVAGVPARAKSRVKMKVLFYFLGILSVAFGLLAIFRAVETALGGGRLSLAMLVFGAVGIFISSIWFRRARALK